MAKRKQVKQLLKWAQDRGWDTTLTRKGHYRLYKEGCGLVFTSSSPSKPSATANCRAEILRAEKRELYA